MSDQARARLVGINHIALEVGDIDEALDFYGAIFDFTMRNRFERAAFIDMGDQFIALATVLEEHRDGHRHFGLVVDSLESTHNALVAAGVDLLPGGGLDFYDPWGNRIQIVEYSRIQFSKTQPVLKGMSLSGLGKSPSAIEELRQKGMV